MFQEHKQKLLQKNYKEYLHTNNILDFYHGNDIDRKIVISHTDKECFKVSFPILNSQVQYATYFNTKEKASKYLTLLLDLYL